MSPFQVPEGPYTIERVMESIREQIVEPARTPTDRPVAPGAALPAAGDEADAAPQPPPALCVVSEGGSAGRLQAQLELMRQRQALAPAYRIHSHRRLIGPLLDLLKRIIHWGARPYVEAIRDQQEILNAAALQALREISVQLAEGAGHIPQIHDRLNEVLLQQLAQTRTAQEQVERVSQMEASIQEQKWGLKSRIAELAQGHSRLGQDQQALWTNQEQVALTVRQMGETLRQHGQTFGEYLETLRRHDESLQQQARLWGQAFEEHSGTLRGHDAALQECQAKLGRQDGAIEHLNGRHDLGPFLQDLSHEQRLALFEQTRGSYDAIEERQRIYAPLFQNRPGPILDVGCGRGELLSLLDRQGTPCYGADPDPAMVEAVRQSGARAYPLDALAVLREALPGSLGGIFAAQLIEHLFPGELLGFLRLAQERLADGGLLVLESLNPATLGVLAKSYYRDLDHKQPIHPEYLKLLLEAIGFEQVQVHYQMPFSEQERLPDLAPAAQLGLPEAARTALQGLIDRLNGAIYGPQDYHLTALKPPPASASETTRETVA